MKKKGNDVITQEILNGHNEDDKRRNFITQFGALGVGTIGAAALASSLSPNDAIAQQSSAPLGQESIIKNINDLRNVTPSFDGQTYFLLGHTRRGIGGGLWYYDGNDSTSVDDNGLCIVTTGNNGGHRIKRQHTAGIVNVEDFGALVERADGRPDSTTAIQAADNAYKGGIVKFGAGTFLFTNIKKSISTSWQGVGSGTNNGKINIESTRFRPNNTENTPMVTIFTPPPTLETDEEVRTSFGSGGIKNVRFLGNFSANAINVERGARQQYFENVYIRGFFHGIHAVGTGELYLDKVFISQCYNGLRLRNVADSWITNSQFAGGSLFQQNNPNFQGKLVEGPGRGILADSCNAIHFTACRIQVSTSSGATFRNCEDLQFISPIVDQSESHGLVLTNCKRVNISNPDIFDNGSGSTTTPRAGILIQSSFAPDDENTTNAANYDGVTRDIRITGGNIYDQNNGRIVDRGTNSSGIEQTIGIQFSNSGVTMRGISIDNVGMENISNHFVNDDQVDGSLRINNIEGLQLISEDIGDKTSLAVAPSGFNTLIYDTPITNNRHIYLPNSGNYEGREFTVVRTENCTGVFDLVVRSNVITTNTIKKRISTTNTTSRLKFSEAFGDWVST